MLLRTTIWQVMWANTLLYRKPEMTVQWVSLLSSCSNSYPWNMGDSHRVECRGGMEKSYPITNSDLSLSKMDCEGENARLIKCVCPAKWSWKCESSLYKYTADCEAASYHGVSIFKTLSIYLSLLLAFAKFMLIYFL